MRKALAGATVAASLAVGGLTGIALGTPVLAGAAETATGAASWVQDALSGLVNDGTITQAQADAVGTALEEARPEGGSRHGGGRHLDLSVVAESLGTTEDELRTALEAGQTIAEVAAEKGVDVQTVIDSIVADRKARLDEKVAAGDLTQAEADERLADAGERATALVNGEAPALGEGRHGRSGDGPDAQDDDADTTDTTADAPA